MSLQDRLQQDLTAAMRSGDVLRRDTLRLVTNAAYNLAKKNQRPLDEDEFLAVLTREVKTRRESVEAFRNGGREDLASKEEAEIAIIAEYLPQALTEDEIRALVGEGIAATGAAHGPRHGQGHGLALPADARPGRRQARERARRPGPGGGRPRRPRRRPRGAAEPRPDADPAPRAARPRSPAATPGRFVRGRGRCSCLILTAIFAVDIVPSGLGLQVGEVAVADVVAPRTITYTSDILTAADQRGRPAARSSRSTTTRRPRPPASPTGRRRPSAARSPRSMRRSTSRSPIAARAALLKAVLPSLSDAGRKTLEGLTPGRAGRPLRDEAANVLDQVERAELRDSDVSTVACGHRAAGSSATCRPTRRRWPPSSSRPLLVPELRVQRGPDRAGPGGGRPGRPSAHGQDPAGREHHRQGPPDHAPSRWRRSRPSTSTRRRSTWPGSVATSS